MKPVAEKPLWRPLAVLAVLVGLAHALVLRATPLQLGSGQASDAGNRAFVTRSIAAEPTPPVSAAPLAAPSRKPAAPAVANTPKPAAVASKNLSNKPEAQINRAQAAPELIAQSALLPDEPAAQAVPDTTPTLTAAVPLGSSDAAATAPIAAAVASTPSAPVIAFTTTPVNAVSLPAPVRLLYKALGVSNSMNYQANAELAWKTNGDSYDATMKVSAFLIGTRSWTSVGKITGSGLAPTRFADKFRNELAAHFQADKGKITFSANTPDVAWTEGVQDRASVFFQLGGVLAANPAGFPVGSSITFLTVGPRDADTWTFVIELEENLQLMGAPMQTLKLTRKPRREFDQKVEIWYAPSLGYLPVRNRITQQSGDFVDQQLVEVVQ